MHVAMSRTKLHASLEAAGVSSKNVLSWERYDTSKEQHLIFSGGNRLNNDVLNSVIHCHKKTSHMLLSLVAQKSTKAFHACYDLHHLINYAKKTGTIIRE